jgi:NAD(P)-dependent dehydrogenase (short-subunit alcohol dehydrogenase family)
MSALDLFRLDGHVALVTGSARGLGAAIAVALAEAGADVAVHDRSDPGATEREIAALGRSRVLGLVADLSDRASSDRLVSTVIERMGRMDILVNNAGIIRRAPAADHPDTDWDGVIEVNLTAVFRLSRAAGRRLRLPAHVLRSSAGEGAARPDFARRPQRYQPACRAPVRHQQRPHALPDRRAVWFQHHPSADGLPYLGLNRTGATAPFPTTEH